MRYAILLLSCLMFSPAMLAASGDAAHNDRPARESRAAGPCHEDLKQYCGNLERGDGRIRQCIDENRTKFSPACQQDMAARHASARQKRQACEPDVQRLCPGIEAGGGRILACLRKHDAELSPACRAAMPNRSHDRSPR